MIKGIMIMIKGIMIMIFIMVILMTGAFYHEVRHQQIFSDYGIKSSIEFRISSLGLVTVPEDKGVPEKEFYEMNRLQHECDNIKYNLAVIEAFLALIFCIEAIKHVRRE